MIFFLFSKVRHGNLSVDVDHPVVQQLNKLQSSSSPKWSVLLPVPVGEASFTGVDEQNDEHRYERAKLAVNQLEASLNPRGSRESRLRKSISQLRPILIQAVADCPADRLTVALSESALIENVKTSAGYNFSRLCDRFFNL